jgi:hypothetical protein
MARDSSHQNGLLRPNQQSKIEDAGVSLHFPSVAGRRVTERETTDVVESGSEVLRKSGMKSWSKAYKIWVNGG